jgi:hypothetical protein
MTLREEVKQAVASISIEAAITNIEEVETAIKSQGTATAKVQTPNGLRNVILRRELKAELLKGN